MLTILHLFSGYQKTVFIIQPPPVPEDSTPYGSRGCKYLLANIRKTASSKPSERELKLVKHVLEQGTRTPGCGLENGANASAICKSPIDPKDAMKSICYASCKWDDVELWSKAIAMFRGDMYLDKLDDDVLAIALSKFGFYVVLPKYVHPCAYHMLYVR